MKRRVEHQICITPERYFEDVYGNHEFQARIAEMVKLRRREVLKEEDRGRFFYREVLQVPDRDLPSIMKKVIGANELSYVNKATYDKETFELNYEVIPSFQRERVSIRGKLRLEPAPGGAIRICELEVDVRVLGVGKLMEKRIMQDVSASQEQVAQLINQHYANR